MGLADLSQTCVSLDLETTGLSPQSDAIIEIGVVRFQGKEILETLHTLVNPFRPLSYRIRQLTGISQLEVDKAPPFAAVAEKLVSLVGSYPLVGQSISFDLSFLSANGVKLSNRLYDTQELARLILPQLPDTSLVALAKALGISYPVQHRALPDALAAKKVFLALLEKATQLDPYLLEKISLLTADKDWSFRPVFQEIGKGMKRASPSSLSKGEPGDFPLTIKEAEPGRPLIPSPSPKSLEPQQLAAFFQEGGAVAKSFPAYEYRPGQVSMMRAVVKALNSNRHLIVEAGTGTGKSLAYLVPAVFFTLENSAPVIISTNTINLQEQLMNKDIPDLLLALGIKQSGGSFRAAQLKGRSNYLCLRRWYFWQKNQRASEEELQFLMRILVWLYSTTTGDRAEINLVGNEVSLWNKVCVPEEDCLARRCLYQQQGSCFLYRARQHAERAHLVVVNHALFLSDIAKGGKILPQYNHLIIDEAHHLEEEATEQLGFRVSQQEVSNYFNHLCQRSGEYLGGLLPYIMTSFRGGLMAYRHKEIEPLADDLCQRVENLQAKAWQFFQSLSSFLLSLPQEERDYGRRLRLTRDTRRQPDWAEVEISCASLCQGWEKLAEGLSYLCATLENLPETGIADLDNLIAELSVMAERGEEMRRQIDSLTLAPKEGMIYWLTTSEQNSDLPYQPIILCAAPLHVGEVVEKLLFSRKECVILTGATLSTEGNFEYLKERLGLRDAEELLLGSPFNYLSSALIYLPQDMPSPDKPGYQQAIENSLLGLCRAVQGHTLALFTSHASLRANYEALLKPLEQEGILLLGQGIDGSAKQVVAAFKSNPRALLLGASSLWEGIDVGGKALKVVVITRLPFAVPTDPIFAARAELFADSFNQYAVPQAILKFKQGFGRLIRSRQDRGAIVVLDQRIQGRSYGKAFLQSLPVCTVKTGPLRYMAREVLGWLG